MTDNKTFPNTEPALPNNTTSSSESPPEQEVKLDPKLSSAMVAGEDQNNLNPTGVNDSGSSTQTQPKPTFAEISAQQASSYIPKKSPPKALLIALVMVGLMLIIGLIIFLFRGSSSEPELVGKQGEITWWGIENSENVVRPLIEKYQEDHPDVKITYIQQAKQDYRERLTSSLAQGKGPDIFEIHNSWAIMFTSELSVLPENILSQEEYKEVFYPVASKDFLTTKGLVAIPLEYDALVMFYNQDIFDSAAINIPTTWDEVLSTAISLTQTNENDVILQSGVALGLIENIDFWQDINALMVLQNGADPAKPNSKVSDALKYYSSFSNQYAVWNNSLPESTLAFSRNKLAILFAPTRVAGKILVDNPNIRFKTSRIPQLPKNKADDPDVTYATYWSQSVWSRSRNAQAAWEFLSFLSLPENLQEMNAIRRDIGVLEKAYPRQDMAILQKEDRILGSAILDAGNATSWYLGDETNDGLTGINSQINEAYRSVLSKAIEGKDLVKELDTLALSIKEIFAKYSQKR